MEDWSDSDKEFVLLFEEHGYVFYPESKLKSTRICMKITNSTKYFYVSKSKNMFGIVLSRSSFSFALDNDFIKLLKELIPVVQKIVVDSLSNSSINKDYYFSQFIEFESERIYLSNVHELCVSTNHGIALKQRSNNITYNI